MNLASGFINARLYFMPVEKRFHKINELDDAEHSSVKVVSDYDYPHSHFPSVIFNLVNLKRINIISGRITEIPEEIGNLRKLQELYITHNEIEQVSTNISQLTRLKKLRLYGNKIRDLTPICFIPNLFKLEIGRNQIKSIPDEIANLNKLKELDLGNVFYKNAIEHISKKIGLLENLEVLSMEGAKLGVLDKPLGELNKLKTLSIRDSKVNEIRFAFDKLQDLQVLDLVNNDISNIPQSLSKAVSLKWIYFDNNPIQEIPESILNLPRLEIFGIAGTQIDLDLVVSYKKRFPWIKFITASNYFVEIFKQDSE